MHRFECDAEQHSFRALVVEAAARAPVSADAVRAWRDLTEGRSSVLDSFTRARVSYLVTTRDVLHAPVRPRSLQMLEQVLTGSYPKRVAADLDLAQSTVALTLKQALERLGAACLPSKVPFGLVALMYAARARGNAPQPQIDSSTTQLLGVECEILTTPMPSLAHLLPPVVEEVLRLHVAGKTHREIAAARGTSPRTVANQLATAYERIGSSGRLNVLEFLLSRCQVPRQYDITA